MQKYKLHTGDCVEIMASLPAESIDLTVTSPPYDNLRNYKGYTFNFKAIAEELLRVTKQGGVVVWIVTDQIKDGSKTLTSFHQGLYFRKIGFKMHDIMIYQKRNTFFSGNGRYTNCHEFMFILSKGKPKTFNPLQTPKKYLMDKRFPTDRTTKHRNNVWLYKVGGGQKTKDTIAQKHPAIFPEKLAEDHILSWSNEGDTVLDPMCGSGTTGKMALKHNRHFIGIDIAEAYIEITRQRLQTIQPTL